MIVRRGSASFRRWAASPQSELRSPRVERGRLPVALGLSRGSARLLDGSAVRLRAQVSYGLAELGQAWVRRARCEERRGRS